jgi:hypothetical protein
LHDCASDAVRQLLEKNQITKSGDDSAIIDCSAQVIRRPIVPSHRERERQDRERERQERERQDRERQDRETKTEKDRDRDNRDRQVGTVRDRGR